MANEIAKRALYGAAKVGGDTLCWCTKCKMELAHVIVSMIDTKPARVMCKTCKSQHNYKSAGGTTTTKTKTGGAKRVTAPKSVVRVAEVWEKKIHENKAAVPFDYNVKAVFKQKDLIQHPKFGMGIVEEVRPGGKVLILFKDGEKVLVHAMGV